MLTLLALLFLVPLTLLVLVPVNFLLTSSVNLFTLPIEMVKVAFDKRRRRNHALEHATVNVLEERYGQKMPLMGFAEQDGFNIQGVATPQAVMAAAREALQRLQAGEKELALHPRCGTNLVSGQLLSALTFFGILFALGSFSLFNILIAMIVAVAVARTFAQPLGLFLQRTLTTSTDVQGLQVDRLDTRMPTTSFALILTAGGLPMHFRVWTNDVHVENPAAVGGPKRYKAY